MLLKNGKINGNFGAKNNNFSEKKTVHRFVQKKVAI
jgi:hypothetical protein